MKLPFFLREALRSVSRNPVPSAAAIASVLVTVLVLGVFIPMMQATTGAANEVRGRVLVDVYLKKDVKDKDVERVRQVLTQDTEFVGKVEFVSKDEALQREKKRNPEAYELLGSNPLPDAFRVTPDEPGNAPKLRDALAPVTAAGARATIDPAIEEVRDRKEDTDKILTITGAVKWSMAILTVLLVLASILLISNTIRLSLYSRRREVEVMKLVGATDSFIRWPFVIEGVMLGALGGGMAVLFLLVGKVAVVDPLASDFALIGTPETLGFGALAGLLIVASVGVSALGSSLSLRRFLRV